MLTVTQSGKWLTGILVLSLASVPLFAAPPSGGGGGKVSVTAANPSEAFQGEELDVTVTGSGFDSGSTVSYLVTGTTDASQVEVISVEFISSTQLKTRIRPKDAALPTEYDIEVRTLSGRKGKGTTLFRVKVAETACTGDEPKEPEIVYLTDLETQGDIYTQDIYLSSGSGCDQFLLLSEAVQIRPAGNGSDPKAGLEYLADVQGIHLDVEGDQGVVVWADSSIQPVPLLSLRFTIGANADITVDPFGPQLVYLPPDDYNVYYTDVRFNELDEIEVVVAEWVGDLDWRIAYVNLDSGASVSLGEGTCPFQDISAECYRPSYSMPSWNSDGTQIYVNPDSWDGINPNHLAVVRINRIAGMWQPAELLMKHNAQIDVIGIRPDGMLAYTWLKLTPRTKGRNTSFDRQWLTGLIDPDDCIAFECSPTDGLQMAADAEKFPAGWTGDGGMLFVEPVNSNSNLRKYADPVSGALGSLDIPDVDRFERDTSY